MSSPLVDVLKLYSIAAVSTSAVGSGFVFLSLPGGIILKVAGAALEVLGIYGLHSLEQSITNPRAADPGDIMRRFRSRLTYRDLAFNAAIIMLISSCYFATMGGL